MSIKPPLLPEASLCARCGTRTCWFCYMMRTIRHAAYEREPLQVVEDRAMALAKIELLQRKERANGHG